MNCRLIWPLLAAAIASGQTITNFAGNGLIGYQGDNGPATQAQISNVLGLAADAAGNIYLADSGNHVVRKVDTSGVITTFAGIGAAGFSGDSGLATAAKLNAPTGVCVGPSGDVYVNDLGNRRVRKIAASTGIITTVAGSGSPTPSGDGGPAISAGMHTPIRCAVDQSGNLYIVDQGADANVVRKVDTNGMISNYAGVYGGTGFSGDNGPATQAAMNNPTAASFDASGNLYVTDQSNQRIRKIDTNGIITTVAGNGIAGFGGDGSQATSASLTSPGETAIDSAGNLFIADTLNQVIREVTAGGTISTVAGIPGAAGNHGDNVPPTSAQFDLPFALTLDPAGNVYVGDTANARVRKIVSLASGPPPCTYSLSSGGQAFPAAGGNGSVNIAAGPGCQWTIPDIPSWIVITGYPANGGSGTVTYQVAPNGAGDRSVTLTGNGLSYTLEQEAVAISGLNVIGSMAHLAAEENWTSTFTLVNKGLVPATARLSFFGDTIDPTVNGPLMLPLVFPQQAGPAGPLLASTFDRALGPSASLIVNSAGPQGAPPVLVGSAQLASNNMVDGFAIFHQIPTGQEAVVPMETRRANSFLLAFDNTSGLVLGVAVENVTAQPAVIPVVVRDDKGAIISTRRTSISLGGNGHTSFVLSDPANGFPETADRRGTIEFDTPPNGGQISVLGLRFTPPNNALTTILAIAEVGTGGGSIAHLASGDDWQTTFVLVNTGSTATTAILNFYADQTGRPLTLPLAFPQSGDGTTMSVSSYTTPQMAAGSTLIIVSSGAPQLLTGSAQITSSGNVSGFVIFRHNNQEAVVPLESRNSMGYIIAFDNTNGTATGIAVNAVSSQQVSIPVTIRNDAGTVLTNDTITLAPNGHYAFTLGIDRYQNIPNILNIRGTIEFVTPQGAAIGALGIRIPAGAAHTYTTLPALAR